MNSLSPERFKQLKEIAQDVLTSLNEDVGDVAESVLVIQILTAVFMKALPKEVLLSTYEDHTKVIFEMMEITTKVTITAGAIH